MKTILINLLTNMFFKTRMNNLYWQVTESSNPAIKLYLYNAYYDNRLWGKPVVKILTTTDQQVEVEKAKWWYENNTLVIFKC